MPFMEKAWRFQDVAFTEYSKNTGNREITFWNIENDL